MPTPTKKRPTKTQLTKERPPQKYPNRLRELRLSRGLVQSEVASRLGITEASVNRHENGNRGLDAYTIDAYARVYNVTPYELFAEPTAEKES